MIEILNVTIAVSADAHNPSILHPSFLANESIVPSTWELAEPPLCTPLMSVVKYSSGISLSVETNRLQVVDNAPSGESTMASTVVEKYTRTLPYVRYRGVGINFSGFMATDEARAVLLRFLAPGPWNHGSFSPEAIGVRFVYSLAGTRLRLAFDGGAIKGSDNVERKGVVVAANYHIDLTEPGEVGQISTAVSRYAELRAHFLHSVDEQISMRRTHAIG